MSQTLQSYNIKDWMVFGITTFQPPFRVSDALINEARIVHVVHGRSRLHSANQVTQLKSGDTVIMKADNFVNHWAENEDGSLNEVIAFQLNTDLLQHLYDNRTPDWFDSGKPGSQVNAVEKAPPHPLVQGFFSGLKTYFSNPAHLSEEVIKIKTKELISILVQIDNTGSIRKLFGGLFTAPSYDFQEVIQNNLFEDLNIDELAFLTSMSSASFKRKFNSIYGTSPNKYITSKRLEKAQTLIRTTELRISDIAFDCGFSDLSYFSKVFKNHFNISPSDLRTD